MASCLLRILALLGIVSLIMLSATQLTMADENDDPLDEEDADEGVEDGEEDWDEDEDADIESMDFNGQTIQFGVPGEDDDFHAMHIPDEHRCEACKIMAKQFKNALDKAHKKRPSLKTLPEYDVIDILEAECEDEFVSVGIKEHDGVKQLTAPGMPLHDRPGIMQGGGKWPMRMKSLCGDIIGEVDEDQIYDLYKNKQLETHLCLVHYPASQCVTVDKISGMKRIEL